MICDDCGKDVEMYRIARGYFTIRLCIECWNREYNKEDKNEKL